MVIEQKNTSRTIQNIIGVILGLISSYLLLTAIVGMLFGIKTPQPYYNKKPFDTYLSDPNAKKAYTKEVQPNEIQDLLDHHPYAHQYKEGVFDCSDMSKEVAKYLESKGYHTSIIGDDNNEHAWVMVWTSQNAGWAIESTSVSEFKNNSGEIVGDDWYDFHFALEDITNGKIYELYYPSVKRDGLHVLAWNDPEVDKH